MLGLRASCALRLLVPALLSCALLGCSAGKSKLALPAVTKAAPPETASEVELIARDPRAYLERVAQNAAALQQYTVVFTRTERRGLLKSLQGPERISCWYRQSPLAIRMKWLDSDVKYGEGAYDDSYKPGKVRFVPRNGFLGLPPSVTTVDVQTPVTWGESRYPMTDFGVARLMARTLESMSRAGDALKLAYRGLAVLPGSERRVHHFHMDFPPADFPNPALDLYVDEQTQLPAGAVMRRPSGEVDSAYFYSELNSQVALHREDFLLEAERTRQFSAASQ